MLWVTVKNSGIRKSSKNTSHLSQAVNTQQIVSPSSHQRHLTVDVLLSPW